MITGQLKNSIAEAYETGFIEGQKALKNLLIKFLNLNI